VGAGGDLPRAEVPVRWKIDAPLVSFPLVLPLKREWLVRDYIRGLMEI